MSTTHSSLALLAGCHKPFVTEATEAVFDSVSESELSASVASLASLKQITSAVTSVIMSMASAVKAAQDAAAASLDHPQASDNVVMLSADPILMVNGQDQASLKSGDRARQVRGQSPQCQESRLAVFQLLTHWSSMPSWLHCHHQEWTRVICQTMS